MTTLIGLFILIYLVVHVLGRLIFRATWYDVIPDYPGGLAFQAWSVGISGVVALVIWGVQA